MAGALTRWDPFVETTDHSGSIVLPSGVDAEAFQITPAPHSEREEQTRGPM